MKYLGILIMTLFTFTGAVSAQEPQKVGEVEAVSIMPIRAELINTTEEDSKEGEGTELDDIGAPAPKPETTAGIMKFDGVDGESKDSDVQPDPIGVTDTAFTPEREMKESGEKGGTEDMNIGIGELQEGNAQDAKHKEWIEVLSNSSSDDAAMNKAELIDAIASNSDGGLRSVYMKIGDIKGESINEALDEDSDGDTILDSEAKEPTASKKKPREIVVVGSKVRTQDVLQVINFAEGEGESARVDSFFDIWVEIADEESARTADSFFDIFVDAGEERGQPDSFFDIFVDVTEEDLHLQAISFVQRDDSVKEIELKEKTVKVQYEERYKLFGLIPMKATRTIVVNPEAEDKVNTALPWWHFLSVKSVDPEEFENDLETSLAEDIPEVNEADDRPAEEVAFYYNKLQAQTLQTMSNVAK
jgi:hypothetical protein